MKKKPKYKEGDSVYWNDPDKEDTGYYNIKTVWPIEDWENNEPTYTLTSTSSRFTTTIIEVVQSQLS